MIGIRGLNSCFELNEGQLKRP